MQKKALVFAAAALAVVAAQPAQAQRRVVRCESRDYRQQSCRAETSGGVRLVRQLGDAACRQGRTWGSTRGGIWVSNGCRGDFEVGRGGGVGVGGILDNWRRDGDSNRNGGWNGGNASARCRSAVASRLNTRAGNVQTWTSRQDRGSVDVGWRVGRSDGTCRVDRNGRVSVRVDRNDSRGRDYDRDRNRGRDRDRDDDRDHRDHN